MRSLDKFTKIKLEDRVLPEIPLDIKYAISIDDNGNLHKSKIDNINDSVGLVYWPESIARPVKHELVELYGGNILSVPLFICSADGENPDLTEINLNSKLEDISSRMLNKAEEIYTKKEKIFIPNKVCMFLVKQEPQLFCDYNNGFWYTWIECGFCVLL